MPPFAFGSKPSSADCPRTAGARPASSTAMKSSSSAAFLGDSLKMDFWRRVAGSRPLFDVSNFIAAPPVGVFMSRIGYQSLAQAVEARRAACGVGHDVVRAADDGRGRYKAPEVRVGLEYE